MQGAPRCVYSPLGTLVVDRLHPDNVDNTSEVALRANGDLHSCGIHLELVTKLVDHAEGVGAGSADDQQCRRTLGDEGSTHRSILLMKASRGTLYRLIWRSTVMV